MTIHLHTFKKKSKRRNQIYFIFFIQQLCINYYFIKQNGTVCHFCVFKNRYQQIPKKYEFCFAQLTFKIYPIIKHKFLFVHLLENMDCLASNQLSF